jgi:hypothetical protein
MQKAKTSPFKTPPPPPSRSTCACGSMDGVLPLLPESFPDPFLLGVICEECVDDMADVEES